MALIGRNNEKNRSVSKGLLDEYLSKGFKDVRLWTGYPCHDIQEIPSFELSGHSSRMRMIHVGDIVYDRTRDMNMIPVIIVNIRHIDKTNLDGVTWAIDYIYDQNKYKGTSAARKIFSAKASDLFISNK